MTDNTHQLAPIAPPQPASAAVIEYDHAAAALPIAGMQDLEMAADILAQGRAFGLRHKSDAFMMLLICHQERISTLRYHQLYHTIQGIPSMRSETMLARLDEFGGEHEIICRTPERAEAIFRYKKAEWRSVITWEEAQKESFVWAYDKSGKKIYKEKYSSPRGRMQMLWARVVSDGVRVVCPRATQGTYTPEEVMDFDDGGSDADSAPRQPRTVLRMAAAGDVIPPIAPPVAEQAPPASMQAPVMQAPPAPETLPSPFDDAPPAAKPSLVDYNVCRCVGTMQGHRWDSMDDRSLELADATYHPDITDGDKAVIQQILAERQRQQPTQQ